MKCRDDDDDDDDDDAKVYSHTELYVFSLHKGQGTLSKSNDTTTTNKIHKAPIHIHNCGMEFLELRNGK